MPTLASSGLRRTAIAAAIVFALVAIAVTYGIRASGRQLTDIEVYRSYGDRMEQGLVPYRDFPVEYPPGALPVFLAPSLVTAEPTSHYRAFAALMAAIGALAMLLTAASLVRLGRSPTTVKRVLALLAVSPLLFGGVVLTRFDLVPVTLVAAATLLAVAGRERAAAATLGAAIAVKLYPLVLLPLLAAWIWRRSGRRAAVTAVALGAGVVALAYLPFFVLSPGGVGDSIWTQLGRPLHSESLGAGVLFVLHNVTGLDLVVKSSHGSLNVAGAGADAIGVVLSVAQVAVLAWLWVRFARHDDEDDAGVERLVRYSAAALAAFVALGKVVSPQFLLWLLFAIPLVAGRRGRHAGACFGLAALATAVWFPLLYRELVRDLDPALSVVLLLRGLALVATVVVLAWPCRAVTATAPAAPRSPSPGPSPGRS